MPISYIKKDNLLLNKLKDYLLNGDFYEGERLPSERVLAEQFGSSRNSLREVIKVLQTVGALEIRPGSGIYVKSLNMLKGANTAMWVSLHKDKVLDLHNVRTALEIKAIELIPPVALPKVAEKLQKCVSSIDINTCDEDAFIKHDEEFHEIIRQASGNEVLCSLCSDITNTIYDERVAIAKDPERKRASYAEHMVIANAFSSCNPSFIKEVCSAHYQSVNQYIRII